MQQQGCVTTVQKLWETRHRRLHIMISRQLICGKGTTIRTEMYLWLPGYRSGRRSLLANTPREHFWTMGHFLHFYCGSFYSTVYICQNSTNCNALKCWLLLYTNYTSTLFLKGRGTFQMDGYCIHLDHELKNIKIIFWNSSQTWTTSRISHDSFVLLWQNTQTWS